MVNRAEIPDPVLVHLTPTTTPALERVEKGVHISVRRVAE
jgi:hypothetical protein